MQGTPLKFPVTPEPSGLSDFDSVLFECSPDCVKLLDPDGHILAINQNGQCVMEIDNFDSVVNLPWTAFWPEQSHQTVYTALEDAREGKTGRFSTFCPTMKGTPKWWDVMVTPIRAPDGRIERLLSISRDVTAEHHANEELQTSKTHFSLLLESSAEGIFGMALDSTCTFINKAGAALLGYCPDELIGRQLHPLIHHHRADGSPYPNYECPITKSIANGISARIDTAVFWRKEGTPVTVSYSVAPVVQDGVQTGAVVTFTDITERKKTEDALQGSEARFRSLANSIPQIVWIVDDQGRAVFFNRQWDLYTGTPIDSMMPADVASQFVHPDDHAITVQAWQSALAEQKVYVVEHRIRSASGEYRWFLVRAEPFFHPDTGKLVQWFGTSTDIHEHKQAEEDLKQAARRQSFLLNLQERLHSLADPREIMFATAEMLGNHLGVDRCGYAEIDDTGQYFDVIKDWTKGDMESLAGHHYLDNFGLAYIGELRQGRSAVFDDAFTSPLTQDEVAKVTFPAVRTRAAISVPLVKGGCLAATLYLTQIEPRQWTEQEQLLARDVAERTWDAVERARAEREKARVEEELRKKDRQKDEFLAMLAHELRNPLAPIGAAAELLQMVKLDEERIRQTSRIIGRQVRHMTSLVDDLLDVSRVTRGLVELDDELLDIGDVVADAVEQVTPLMRSRQHHLGLQMALKAPLVMGDKKRLVQIIANLLNNAAKYTPEGGDIQVKTEVRNDDVLIQVIDNGIGMAPELACRAFDLFTQAERTSDRISGGLGLGLALVKSLVELHQGTVTAYSPDLGKGSTFTVRLPRLRTENCVPGLQNADATPQPATRPLRIMVVDDNADAASMLGMLLEASGHEVLIEHGSQKALERARKEAPQVCVLDIGLPEIDGNELAKRLRAQPETAQSVLIAVTGYGQENDRKQTQAAGFDHHLVKPVDTAQLSAILRAVNDPDSR
jgi:PAS domain S-box-containing protein